MYHTVVVALDGSPLAERALPYAQTLARASGARLILVRAAAVPTVADRDDFEEHLGATQAEAAAYLQAAVGRLREQDPELAGRTETVAVPVRHGSVAAALRQTARERGADVLVLATHGRSGLGRWLYGSVADAVLRQADVPVLLVPAACEDAWNIARAGRILVPLDGSAFSEEALPPAADLAAVFGAHLELLQVVELPTYPYGAPYATTVFDPTAELEAAKEHLETLALALREQGRSVTVRTEVGRVGATIATVARERDADLIAMATRGRGGATRLVMGSVATSVLHHSCSPVLLVRPTTPATGQAAQPAVGAAALTGR
jgi:nucleotide-binding universal stress UspA family protein